MCPGVKLWTVDIFLVSKSKSDSVKYKFTWKKFTSILPSYRVPIWLIIYILPLYSKPLGQCNLNVNKLGGTELMGICVIISMCPIHQPFEHSVFVQLGNIQIYIYRTVLASSCKTKHWKSMGNTWKLFKKTLNCLLIDKTTRIKIAERGWARWN